MNDVAGVQRFARYAAPPNRHGYCGPGDFVGLSDAVVQARSGDDLAISELRHSAHEFIGAYPYLELLAAVAGVQDPLGDEAVEAYWIGNPVLSRVPTGRFGWSLYERFRRRSGQGWPHLELAVPGALCNHAFHVLVASPWVGLMRNGVVDEPLAIVDDCRVSWGSIRSIDPTGGVVVARTPVIWSDGRLVPGGVEDVPAQCSLPVEIGDVVSLHWGHVCDVLTATQLAWLRYVTRTQLAVAAAVGRPS